jgi:hypothetical protein
MSVRGTLNQVIDYVKELGERADKIRMRAVEPSEDNMLKVSSDGRQAALDMRLVTGETTEYDDLLNLTGWSPTPSKVDVAAARIAQIWSDNTDRTYYYPGTDLPLDVPADSFELAVHINLPKSVEDHLKAAEAYREQAAEANRRASEEARVAAKILAAEMPLREVGAVLDVSHQRVHQLVNS